MENGRFDSLTRSFATSESRRGILHRAVAGLAALGLGAGLVEDAEAARCAKPGKSCKPRKGKKRKCCRGSECVGTTCQCKGNKTRCGNHCVNLNNDPKNCGDCGTKCPPETPDCQGGSCTCGSSCFCDTECCSNDDCPGLEICLQSGECFCDGECCFNSDCPGLEECSQNGSCICRTECCVNSDCDGTEVCSQNGTCICETECCSNDDCPGLEICLQSGACFCDGECCFNSDCPQPGGTCDPPGVCDCGECCFNDDCEENETCVLINQTRSCFCQSGVTCGLKCCAAGQVCGQGGGICVDT